MLRKRSDVKTQAPRKFARELKKLRQLKSKDSKSKRDIERRERNLDECRASRKCSKSGLLDAKGLDS